MIFRPTSARGEVDNMKGLDVHDADSDIATMISDDNFSMLQRTLLLRFGWFGLGQTRGLARRGGLLLSICP